MILAGDVGGTKTVLALFEKTAAGLQQRAQFRYASGEFESFDELLQQFLDALPSTRPESACLGVAGVVNQGRVDTTNLPWQLDEGTLAKRLGA